MARKTCRKILFLLIIPFISCEIHSKLSSGPSKLKLAWSNCGTDSDPVKISFLDITPEPLSVPGLLTLTADAEITSNISSPIKASVLVKKKSFLGWMEIPCLDDIGSCSYENICVLTPFKDPCPPIFSKHNIPCTCPIKQGQYSVNKFTFPVKAIGPHWLEHGKYKARVTLSHDDHLLACYEFNFNLK